jgi:integrase/recombinase XerD
MWDPMALDFSLQDLKVSTDSKQARHGKAKILTPDELAALFDGELGLPTPRDRFLFGLCYFTGARIGEVLALTIGDIVGDLVTYRASTTKTGETRQATMCPALVGLMDEYQLADRGVAMPAAGPIFPGRHGRGHMTRVAADGILRAACDRLAIVGASTHSFRRSFVTQMQRDGKTPAQIAKYTGHKSLGVLLEYFGS